VLILNANEVQKALPMAEVIAATKNAYAALSAGKAKVPLRIQLPVDAQEAVAIFMPAYLWGEKGGSLALKAVSVFPRNPKRGLPVIHAAVLVFAVETGKPLALLEGGRLTAIRTGAASGAATDLLARPDSKIGAIFGTGVQGRTQLEAICTVRSLEEVWVYDLDPERVDIFIEEMAGKGPIPHDLRIADSPRQAISQADIICTATTSPKPVFADEDLKPGTHINGVGSYTPEMIEIPPETAGRVSVFVGSQEGVLAEAGEIIAAIEQDLIVPEDLIELGEVIRGNALGRTSPDQITFFKSVGVAVQDAAAARLALDNAQAQNLGQEVDW